MTSLIQFAPSQALTPAAAGDGEVWQLEHIYVDHGGLCTVVRAYLDPAKAVRDLATAIRPRWSVMADPLKSDRPEGMPDTAPVNDFEAVAWYFASPYPLGDERHEVFELWRQRIDDEVVERPAGEEYALSGSFQEMLCVCGNTGSADGFTDVDEHGRDATPASNCWLRCERCMRLLHAVTGQVGKTLTPGRPGTLPAYPLA